MSVHFIDFKFCLRRNEKEARLVKLQHQFGQYYLCNIWKEKFIAEKNIRRSRKTKQAVCEKCNLEINGVCIIRKKYHYGIPFCRFQEKNHITGINTTQSEHLNQLRTEEPVLVNLFILYPHFLCPLHKYFALLHIQVFNLYTIDICIASTIAIKISVIHYKFTEKLLLHL